MREVKAAFLLVMIFIFFAGLIFPGIIWLGAQFFFHEQANGSLIKNKSGEPIGSTLIGQNFTLSKYFHPRPSAAGSGYDASSSSGTNLGPNNKKLIDTIKDFSLQYRKENYLTLETYLPTDAVTHSASGLDPHISPENAHLQSLRIAQTRGLPQQTITELIINHIETRFIGIFGEAHVNVLKLNLALDQMQS
jgi:potassium-transporting ATPase KdpC subunit